jgi:starch phosphorylase
MKEHKNKKYNAYFSLEIAIKHEIKSYAGGLGILAGDTLKSAADMGVNLLGITLLYKNGYFKQSLDPQTGEQIEKPDTWDYKNILILEKPKFSYIVEGRQVQAQIWRYDLVGLGGHISPIYFLDVDLESNNQEDRYTNTNLYSGYEHTRIRQEMLLGIGGVKAMEALGIDINKYHLNESHAAFAAFELKDSTDGSDISDKIVFTTHTPVKHGHRGYTADTYYQYLDPKYHKYLDTSLANKKGKILLTDICFENSCYANAVAKKHQEVTKGMFPDRKLDFITNGIHHLSWISPNIAKIFDEYLPIWRSQPEVLRNAFLVPDTDLKSAHLEDKKSLVELINQTNENKFEKNVFTIGFARRSDAYKRPDFILRDLARLKTIAQNNGGLQIVFAGKAFFNVAQMEEVIKYIYKESKLEKESLKIAYLEDYNMNISKFMLAGSDIWLNTPIRPLEASGTSGMKAALNGVPNFSVVDGWWVEGWIEGVTGWAIGDENSKLGDEDYELDQLYKVLETKILPTFKDQNKWATIQKQAIAMNASYFNTNRMLKEYIAKAYF